MNRRHALTRIVAAVSAMAAPRARADADINAEAARPWAGMTLLQAAVADAKANITGFGASAADTTVSGATLPTLYIDSLHGDEDYDGLSDVYDGTHGPKARLSTSTSAPDEFWAVVTGSTFTTDYQPNVEAPGSVHRALIVQHANFKLAAWSRLYRQEVKPTTPGYRNVFDAILNTGTFFDPAYADKYFFKLAGNGFNAGYTRGSQGCAIGIAAPGAVIRNAWCDGHPLGLANSNGPAFTAEDWVISRAWRAAEPGQNKGLGTGYAFRHTANDVPGCRIARGMTAPGSIGEDLLFQQPTVAGNGPQGTSVVDCVLLHDCVAQTDECMHADVLQTGHGPGALLFRRVLIQHRLNDAVLANVQGGGRAVPQGSALQIPNGSGNATYTASPTLTDVLIATNTNAINVGPDFNWSGTFTWNRLGVYLVRNQQFSDSTMTNYVKIINYNNPITTAATNCRLVFVNPHFTPLGAGHRVDGFYTRSAAASITSGVTLVSMGK